MYYSPAFHCPIGWSTAGVAAMSNGSPSISGIFSGLSIAMETRTYTMDDGTIETLPPWNWRANRITSALGPDETVLVCRPRFVGLSKIPGSPYLTDYAATIAASQLTSMQRHAMRPLTPRPCQAPRAARLRQSPCRPREETCYRRSWSSFLSSPSLSRQRLGHTGVTRLLPPTRWHLPREGPRPWTRSPGRLMGSAVRLGSQTGRP
jgi:hypothetical protein